MFFVTLLQYASIWMHVKNHLLSLFVCVRACVLSLQELHSQQHQPDGAHGQRAVALLAAVVRRRRVLSVLGGAAHP